MVDFPLREPLQADFDPRNLSKSRKCCTDALTYHARDASSVVTTGIAGVEACTARYQGVQSLASCAESGPLYGVGSGPLAGCGFIRRKGYHTHLKNRHTAAVSLS